MPQPFEEPRRPEDERLVRRGRENVRKIKEAQKAKLEAEQTIYRRTMDWIHRQMAADHGLGPRPKRRRRKPPGGELAPVKPRPKPTPLMDGAEAPID